MEIKFLNREPFYICGYFVETSLDTCEKDLQTLWNDFDREKKKINDIFGAKNGTYGLMWYTQNHHYCYLIGIEIDMDDYSMDKMPDGACCKYIKGAKFAIAYVPHDVPAVDAWTQYFNEILPQTGYTPDYDHGMFFEYYPPNGKYYELWTPIVD